jgi:hypothetical protein
MADLSPPTMLFATLVEDGDKMVVVNAEAAVFDPTNGGTCARQLGKRSSNLPEGRLRAALTAARSQLTVLGRASLSQSARAVRQAVEQRLFAAMADSDHLVTAAGAELKAAAALDAKLEFNRAAVRGAELMLTLAEDAWQVRAARLKGIEAALAGVAKLKPPKFFWVVPKASSSPLP